MPCHLGFDADTQAAIAGALAEAAYGGVPASLWADAVTRLPDDLRAPTEAFVARYGVPIAAG